MDGNYRKPYSPVVDTKPSVDIAALDKLIEVAKASGGGERANYQIFISGLCKALGLDEPTMSREANWLNDYVFERRLDYKHPDGSTTPLYADCYRKGCFVLEAKQSARRQAADQAQTSLFPEESRQKRLGHARRGSAGWDRVMRNAYHQAVDYTRQLPVEHGYPPFVIVVDVGNVIELYADFSGQGKNYAQFPDRQSYRIEMDGLRDQDVQRRLQAIWTDPHSLDPAKRSAEVTRDIAGRLAKIAKRLEGKHDPRDVAEFLMRCLFTMFAEDVGLLPEAGFAELLKHLADHPQTFPVALENLWKTMDEGGYEPRLMTTLRRFNGSLFKNRRALPLAAEDIHELYVAATQDWSEVEPAIFGTLLERALDPRERSKLGAHYTPRAYVERLVIPTIIEPLRADWEEVQARVVDLKRQGLDREALQAVRDYHHQLCTTRVLDPACGTGNFLYVSLELMKKLEGEVLVALEELGQEEAKFAMEGETVGPRQFFGLDVNSRAVPIADLVLWIGYLKWQLRTVGLSKITEPVLDAYGTIKHQDAIVVYDRRELMTNEHGQPLTRWDGVTNKVDPITGEEVPDPSARVEVYKYLNPRPAPWPEADFIVGNPPFIGGKDMRSELGDGYAEAAWKVRPHVPGGADFVMHFWAEAASRLVRRERGAPRRFGFITTNSITQTFSRRVVEDYMSGATPVSLVFAIPNHPWLKASDKAAVRIAMTVAGRGDLGGIVGLVVGEADLDSDTPQVTLSTHAGKVRSNLSIGADLSSTTKLASNEGLGVKGFELGTQALLVDIATADSIRTKEPSASALLRPYVNGNDFKNGRVWRQVIDTYPRTWSELNSNPEVQNYLVQRVKNSRSPDSSGGVLAKWWQFRRSGEAIRDATHDLSRFVATTRTAKHRFFAFLDPSVCAESKTVIIALEQGAWLAILSSRIHVEYATRQGGRQGVGNDPVYQHTDTFDTFPFPELSDHLLERLNGLGERLDAFRKARLLHHGFLTMTSLYNVLERIRELESGAAVEPLDDGEEAVHEAGLVSTIKEIHDEIDRAVLNAYSWPDLIPLLVGRPGATTPSLHKSEAQEAAEEELLTRLVALNRERSVEEARGLVRWLRPEYQIPRFGAKSARPDGMQIEADVGLDVEIAAPKWPGDAFDQIKIVRDVLAKAPAPAMLDSIAAAFGGRVTDKRKARVEQVLETLVATGAARTGQLDGVTRYFVPR